VSPTDLSVIKAIAFDFDGVFTDDRVLVSETGAEHVFCSRSDGLGIGMLRAASVHMVIIHGQRRGNPKVHELLQSYPHVMRRWQCDTRNLRFRHDSSRHPWRNSQNIALSQRSQSSKNSVG
jgi:hypothetical protein